MINEIKNELNKMNQTYQEGLSQLDNWEKKLSQSNSPIDLSIIKELKTQLKDLSENLTHVSLTLDDSLTDEKLTKLTYILENLNDKLSPFEKQSNMDALLGIIDNLDSLHFVQVEQFEAIKSLIESESESH